MCRPPERDRLVHVRLLTDGRVDLLQLGRTLQDRVSDGF